MLPEDRAATVRTESSNLFMAGVPPGWWHHRDRRNGSLRLRLVDCPERRLKRGVRDAQPVEMPFLGKVHGMAKLGGQTARISGCDDHC